MPRKEATMATSEETTWMKSHTAHHEGGHAPTGEATMATLEETTETWAGPRLRRDLWSAPES